MKLLKVKIKRSQSLNKTSYTYPPEYDAKKINVVAYESTLTGGYDKVVGRGNTNEFCIGAVKDEDAAQFLKSKDITEITKAQAAVFFGDDLDKRTEKISDQSVVLSILAKSARQETLTDQEKKAIDPNDPAPGITLSRSYNDALKELGF